MNCKKTISFLLSLALMAGCAAPAGDAPADETPASGTQTSGLQPETASAVAAFTWKLFDQMHTSKENTVMSGLSAFFALGMAANGASGQTLSQMEDVLGLSVADINLASKSALEQTGGEQNPLHLANSAWIARRLSASVQPDFQTVLEQDYHAPVNLVSFDETTVRDVNDWVSDQTDGMIDQMVDTFHDPAVVLINAVSFDGRWQDPYDSQAMTPGVFRNADGTDSDVTMMQSKENSYVSTSGFEGFVKPYEDGRYVFAALLPKEGPVENSIESALETQDEAELFETLARPESRTVHAALPEFTASTEKQLNDALETLGITDAFQDNADFSNISPDASFFISEVLQKAKIEVNAQGTKASAATDVAISETASLEDDSVTITCDRPFLYLILDTDTNLPVFMGTYQMAAAD